MTTETICPVCDAPLGAHDETGHPTTTIEHLGHYEESDPSCAICRELYDDDGFVPSMYGDTPDEIAYRAAYEGMITESEARVLDGNR